MWTGVSLFDLCRAMSPRQYGWRLIPRRYCAKHKDDMVQYYRIIFLWKSTIYTYLLMGEQMQSSPPEARSFILVRPSSGDDFLPFIASLLFLLSGRRHEGTEKIRTCHRNELLLRSLWELLHLGALTPTLADLCSSNKRDDLPPWRSRQCEKLFERPSQGEEEACIVHCE